MSCDFRLERECRISDSCTASLATLDSPPQFHVPKISASLKPSLPPVLLFFMFRIVAITATTNRQLLFEIHDLPPPSFGNYAEPDSRAVPGPNLRGPRPTSIVGAVGCGRLDRPMSKIGALAERWSCQECLAECCTDRPWGVWDIRSD